MPPLCRGRIRNTALSGPAPDREKPYLDGCYISALPVGGALFLYLGGDRMPLCPLDGHCAYNNRNVCGVDYCLFPVGGCPHDLLQNPPGDPVLYRRALGGTIAVLAAMGRPEDDAILMRLRGLFRISLSQARDKGGGTQWHDP